jgi:hypothetical protein
VEPYLCEGHCLTGASQIFRRVQLSCLIGISGEFLTVKLNPSSIEMTVEEFKCRRLQAGGNISEPGFILQM